jgi:hypothetical protein
MPVASARPEKNTIAICVMISKWKNSKFSHLRIKSHLRILAIGHFVLLVVTDPVRVIVEVQEIRNLVSTAALKKFSNVRITLKKFIYNLPIPINSVVSLLRFLRPRYTKKQEAARFRACFVPRPEKQKKIKNTILHYCKNCSPLRSVPLRSHRRMRPHSHCCYYY